MKAFLPGILGLLLSLGSAIAQPRRLPPQLDSVNRLGRTLYQYDQVWRHANDGMLDFRSKRGATDDLMLEGFVIEREGSDWRVAFGALAPDNSALLVSYDVRLDSGERVLDVREFVPPEPRTGVARTGMLAWKRAMEKFVPVAMAAHVALPLPMEDGRLAVYVLPRSFPDYRFYLGGDARCIYDPVADSVTELAVLHKTVAMFDLSDSSSATTRSFATGFARTIVTETDVLYAMSRPEAPPGKASHVVIGDGLIFFLRKNGIVDMMTGEQWLQDSGNADDLPH